MTYVLDDKEFADKKQAEHWAHAMAKRDAVIVFSENNSITKEEADSYIEMRTKLYEKQINIKEEK